MNPTGTRLKNIFSTPYFYVPVLLLTTFGIYHYSSKASSAESRINPGFINYISAYTSGSVSRESGIRIQLAGNFGDSSMIGHEAHVFSFDPSIEGKAMWVDASTIEFKPTEPLPSGKKFDAVFRLDKILEVPSELGKFPFSFQVIAQSFEVQPPAFAAMFQNQLVFQRVSGTLLTADVEQPEKVAQLLSATFQGKSVHIKWEHAADKRTHTYMVDSLQRGNSTAEFKLSWTGTALGIDNSGEHKLEIPALNDFKVVGITVQDDGEQYLSVNFSDPIMQQQDLNGLVTLNDNPGAAGKTDMRFTVNGNEVRCYPQARLSGDNMIYVHQGIRNILGYPFAETIQQRISFEDVEPMVRVVGKGVILPQSDKLLLPVEAAGLRAIDVSVVKIFESNIAQFLQVNELDGERELKRVGRMMAKKTVRLDDDKLADLRRVNRYSIDLGKLIRTEPGALYQVRISFRKEYAVYTCHDAAETEEATDHEMKQLDENWDDAEENEGSYWDFADEYYDEDYNWSDRDNPCKSSYYNPSRWVRHNVLATNIGMIAKKGNDGSMFFTTTDIRTAQPMSGVTLELLNYQQQVIQSVKTDNNGWVHVKATAEKPFLVIAKNGPQRGYLKVNDGASLSLSRFDVSGDVVQKGIKGFLYGERGVWRPGDSLYLSFILDDRDGVLPQGHPVSFELYNPMGLLTRRMVKSRSLNGFYNFSTATDEDAPTGTWSAKVKVGSVEFQKNIRIETVIPNRLKINLDFGKPYLVNGDGSKTVLSSAWLHGAIASNLDAKIDVTLSPALTTFKRFEQYIFDDPSRKFSAESQTVFEGKLDENGKAGISPNIQVENRPAGMLNANFVTKVFEPGGSFSVDRFSIPFHPYKNYIGINVPHGDAARQMLLTDTTHTIRIVSLKPDGSFEPGQKKVKVFLYKVEWRWWWDQSEENLSSYAESESYQPLQQTEVTLTNGIGKWNMRVNYPDWGRYFIRVEDSQGGHSTGKSIYIDWPGWAGRARRDNPQEATMLSFNSDKPTYKVGETATVTIPGSKLGRALVSIESGTKVIETHWVETQEGQSRFTFKVSSSMAPNIYVHVTLLQPHAQTTNDLPIRLYGMIPLMVQDPQTELSPKISMQNEIRPETPVNIQVSEATGKPMTYTLAIVDEGLLDLTRFKTPDPHGYFYAREALGVKTWDMFDYVLGAFGSQMNRVLSIGGDEGLNRKGKGTKANRFKPVVLFLGPFHADAGQTVNHNIKLPQYIGSVRVMVVAGEKSAYGFAEKAVPVKKPLMILATLPRVIGPGESVKLPVSVFATGHNMRNVTVQVQSSPLLQAMNGTVKTIRFDKPGDEMVDFDMRAAAALGIARVKVIASSGSERAEYDIELDVRNPNPFITRVYDGMAESTRSWSTAYTPVGMNGTNSAVLELSSIPPINLGKRLDYLIQYPHGCVEQTTSSVFPQLALKDLMDLDPRRTQSIETNVKAGIQKLRGFQNSDGGLSYWPGTGGSDDWGTSYAGHFMIEAQNNGYALPLSFLPNWKKYQRNAAINWTLHQDHSNDLVQAYRLYTLALAKAPELGAMNRLREIKTLSAAARWRLAAAYALAGQRSIAQELIVRMPVTVKPYTELSVTYGSDVRDEAMILETLVLLGDQLRAGMVLQTVAKHLGAEEWMSTQSTAYSLLAIAKLCGKLNDQKTMDLDYVINGKQQSLHSAAHVVQIPISIRAREAGSVRVVNKGKGLLYTRVIMKGQPETGSQFAESANLQMEISYRDMKGNALNPAYIEQGTDFKAEVTITNPGLLGNYEQMALSQVFPSGWEIHNSRLDNNETGNYTVPTYQDIRDDRVYTYFNLATRRQAHFVVLLNASYLGKYYLPTITCDAMYNARIHASKAGMWVQVVPKGAKTAIAAK